VDQVTVNIDDGGLSGLFVDNVAVPNFLVESFRGGHSGVGWILALWRKVGTSGGFGDGIDDLEILIAGI